MTSITQVYRLEDNTDNLEAFTKEMMVEFVDWYKNFCNTYDGPPLVEDIFEKYADLRRDAIIEELANAPSKVIEELSQEYRSFDLREIAFDMADQEFINDCSLYNSIIDDVYHVMKLSLICSDENTPFLFSYEGLSSYPFGPGDILGAQVCLASISPLSGRVIM